MQQSCYGRYTCNYMDIVFSSWTSFFDRLKNLKSSCKPLNVMFLPIFTMKSIFFVIPVISLFRSIIIAEYKHRLKEKKKRKRKDKLSANIPRLDLQPNRGSTDKCLILLRDDTTNDPNL